MCSKKIILNLVLAYFFITTELEDMLKAQSGAACPCLCVNEILIYSGWAVVHAPSTQPSF